VLPYFHNVVVSPGPGVPSNSTDFGVCARLLQECSVPVLGVCLGHQGLAYVSGAEVVQAPRVAHGVVSQVQHTDDALFQGVPVSFRVVRYHSWIVSEASAFSQHLECIARSTDDGLVMAIKHKTRPMWGVQFHPESICTEYGKLILQNFRDLSLRHCTPVVGQAPPLFTPAYLVPPSRPDPTAFPYHLRWRKLAGDAMPSQEVFCKLFADSEKCFWLDSSRSDSPTCRYSYIGSCDGPLAFYTSYHLALREVRTWKRRGFGQAHVRALSLSEGQSFFDVVDRKLAKRRVSIGRLSSPHQGAAHHSEAVPECAMYSCRVMSCRVQTKSYPLISRAGLWATLATR
jgi:para-aminobenzoate synthetase